MKKTSLIISLLLVASLWTTTQAQPKQPTSNGYTTEYVELGRKTSLLYKPAVVSEKNAIGVVVMHSNDDYLGFPANSELSKRGYTVLATVPAEGDIMDEKILNIKRAVEYLRNKPGINKVLLLGHSGGATVMTAYQMLAEQGVDVLKTKIFSDYTANLANLPKADGMLLLDANYGNAVMRLISLDPNIHSNGKGNGNSNTLDLASPDNGYNANGVSHYSDEFVKKYIDAQASRLADLTKVAEQRFQLVKQGKGDYTDDEPFIVAGANQIRPFNKLFPQDLRLLSHTKKAWPLVHGDGSVTTEIILSVRAPMRADAKSDKLSASMVTTVRGFLSACAIRVTDKFMIREDGFEGIDWTSNINNPIGNSEGITVPVLMMGMTGSWEYLAAEHIYNHIGSKDKSMAFVEGASHMFFADRDAEKFNNTKYGDTTTALFNYVDKWLSQPGRFLPNK